MFCNRKVAAPKRRLASPSSCQIVSKPIALKNGIDRANSAPKGTKGCRIVA